MPITAAPRLKEYDYIPDSEREEDIKTTFKLLPLDQIQYNEVLSHYDAKSERLSLEGFNLACKYGIKGWSNFNDDNGKSLKFNPLYIKRIPSEILIEIGSELFQKASLSGEAEKNS